MAKQALLSHEETMELIKANQAGSVEAREKLVTANERLVWSAVQRYANRGYNLEDLFQIGAIGLIKSIDKFDAEFNVKFSTYAIPMIIGEIQRFLRDDGMLKVSRRIKEVANNIKRHNLADKTPEHINEVLELDHIELARTALEYIKKGVIKSMDDVVHRNGGEGEDLTIKDQLPGDVNGDNWLDNIALREALTQLTEREQLVINLRYFRDLTQTEAAEELGVSQVQISRIEKKVIEKLRNLIQEADSMPREHKGDRQQARELLRTTELTLKQISDKTGVPFGTVGTMATKHRSAEVTASVRAKAAKRSQETVKQKKKEKRKEKQQPVVNTEPTPTPVQIDPSYDHVFAPKVSTGHHLVLDGKDITLTDPTLWRVGSPVADTVSVIVPKADVPKKASSSFSFNFDLGVAGDNVPKEEAISRLKETMNILKRSPIDTVSFSLKAKN